MCAEKFQSRFPPNIVRNQKYNIFTFFPVVLYEQFKFFFNLYFLLVALSQFIPALKIGAPIRISLTVSHVFIYCSGFIITYVAPLAFVLCVTMGKEAYDDYKRNLRDREANSQKYLTLVPPSPHKRTSFRSSESATLFDVSDPELQEQSHSHPDSGPHTRSVPSSSLKVGDLVLLEKNDRVPTDMILLRTSDPSGTCFIRTDQLDGETDWKARVAVTATQGLKGGEREIMILEGEVYADAPIKDIHNFVGTITVHSRSDSGRAHGNTSGVESLSAENMLWANTVLAAGSAVGFVVYTGSETRAVMNTSHPETKVGLLDLEINRLAKVRPVQCLTQHSFQFEVNLSLAGILPLKNRR